MKRWLNKIAGFWGGYRRISHHTQHPGDLDTTGQSSGGLVATKLHPEGQKTNRRHLGLVLTQRGNLRAVLSR